MSCSFPLKGMLNAAEHPPRSVSETASPSVPVPFPFPAHCELFILTCVIESIDSCHSVIISVDIDVDMDFRAGEQS